ncbi:MAG TPA: hypothetical protein DEQ40_03825 [Oxalobacteraceae bacterium]|nr:hypothetical protein [Oxalobacteraceae bacterium]
MVFSILWKTACTIGMARGPAEGAVRRISRAIVQQGQAGATVFSRIWQKAIKASLISQPRPRAWMPPTLCTRQ